MVDTNKNSLEHTLLEVLRDLNLKQAELNELSEQMKKLEEEVENYKSMYEDYKEAADDRWDRLKVYEENIIIKKLCSLQLKLKKKDKNKDSVEKEEESYKRKYWELYTESEKNDFLICQKKLENVKYKPLISLVIPVYNTDLRMLDELFYSITEQIYDKWEVCFANGSKDNIELNKKLKDYALHDKRVHYSLLEKNGGISYNTNEAFYLAAGEYIGMVDHDDLLAPNALAEVVLALNAKRDIEFLYSDQDKVDEKTTMRFGAFYKPFWSKELLYSGNYITHFSVLKKSIIEQVGLWDSSTDGAQDWDLFLKVTEKTEKVYAIPKILYHWRTAPTSTAASMDTKNYAAEAQIKCLQNHFNRMNYNAKVSFSRPKDLQIHVEWNNDLKGKISFIIWDEGGNQDLNSFIWFATESIGVELKEIIVVSTDSVRLESIKKKCKKLICESPNYAEGYNKGAEVAEGEILIFSIAQAPSVALNTYHELSVWCKHPEIGLVGPKVLTSQKVINSLGIVLNQEKPQALFGGQKDEVGRLTAFGTTGWYRNVNAMNWYCFAISREKYKEIGNFNIDLGLLSMIDYCIRVGRKYRNLINPFAVVQYNLNYSKLISEERSNEYKKILKDYRMPEVDKYYNPVLVEK